MSTERIAPEDNAELFDVRLVVDVFGFVLRALRRRLKIAIMLFLATILLVGIVLVLLPRAYHTQTRILAQRNLLMPALSNPNRSVPGDADAPTKSAAETVLKRDNLVALIKQTNLMDEWDTSRPILLRFKDWALALVEGPLDEEEKLDRLVGLLEQRLYVATEEGSIVSIGILWSDPHLAFRIVEAAQQNFLEARHASEISTIAETISILEGHAANVRETIEATLDEMKKQRLAAKGEAAPRPRRVIDTGRRDSADKEIAELRVMLQAKRRAISDLEEFRQRRLTELQGQLNEQVGVYAAGHPTIANTKQNIQSLSDESPQISQLKREENDLMGEYKKRGGRDPERDTSPAPVSEVTQMTLERESRRDADDDEVATFNKSRLRIAVNKYEALLERIDGARIELDTARAAFKYRYSIITPASLPKAPAKPRVPLLAAAGFIIAIMLSVVAAAGLDLASGKILESWQVEQRLGLPVLGEVKRP